MQNFHMRSAAVLLLTFCLLGSATNALAEDEDTQTDTKDTNSNSGQPPGDMQQGLSSKKSDKDGATKFGSPHGPALDGIRGSAPPAPGAFGTDARDPDDLRR